MDADGETGRVFDKQTGCVVYEGIVMSAQNLEVFSIKNIGRKGCVVNGNRLGK